MPHIESDKQQPEENPTLLVVREDLEHLRRAIAQHLPADLRQDVGHRLEKLGIMALSWALEERARRIRPSRHGRT